MSIPGLPTNGRSSELDEARMLIARDPESAVRLIATLNAMMRAWPAPEPAAPPVRLTPRERTIAVRVARGESNKRIARELGITEGTVKSHLHSVFRKLTVENRVQLARRLDALGTNRASR